MTAWQYQALGLAVGFAVTAGASAAATPGAFDLLEKIRRAYADLESYSDLGEIETTTGDAGADQTTLGFFETALTTEGRFLWRIHSDTESGFEERVVWTDSEQAFVFSSLRQQYQPVPSLIGELSHALGRGSFEALVVPLLLAGADDVLAAPAAVVEGSEPCGSATCWVIAMTHMSGTIESELRVDQQTLRIHEVLVRVSGSAPGLEPSNRLPDDGVSAIAAPLTIRVSHHPGPVSVPTFAPPAGARRVAEWDPRSPVENTRAEDLWLGSAFTEEITVALLTVVARVIDARGEPILGLEPADLIVRVGPAEARVVDLEWSSSAQAQTEIPPVELTAANRAARAGSLPIGAEPPAMAGKLIVFFLQIDFAPSRLAGHLKILPDVERLLRSLYPSDRIAIVSFDSHLKLWQDFTSDRQAAMEALKQAISFGSPAARKSFGLSLLEHFDPRAALDAASPERALQVTAEALTPLPGEKDLIYLGWGLGRYGAGGVRMTAAYQPAVRALDEARATVFVLDVSQADYHSLEVGLQNVAAHTGGTYSRTLHFASQAVSRLARTLGGFYLVTIDRTATPGARGRLNIELRDKKGEVRFRPLVLH